MDNRTHKKNFFRFIEPALIAVLWILVFASPIILSDQKNELEWSQIYNMWLDFIPLFILFLVNRFILLPYLFFRNKRWQFVASAVLLISVMAFSIHYNDITEDPPNRHERQEMFRNPPGGRLSPREPGNQNFLPPKEAREPKFLPPPRPGKLPRSIGFMIISLLIIGFDTGLKLSVKWVQSEQKRMSVEKENVETQLAFLRNQVSPHFFMNTLNNIHVLIDIDTEEAKESVIKLSKLMRHLLYDSEAEKIPLHKEFEFIQNYVELMKLRYSEKVKINLHLPAQTPDKQIPPLLFTSFVENAFKHGISYQQASFVDIAFTYSQENLIFEIRNSKTAHDIEIEKGGIGIENSRKRLDLIYGDSYSLNIEDKKDEYIVNLKIPV